MRLIPIERCWRATAVLRNRHAVTFTCAYLTTSTTAGRLTRIDVTAQRGFPHYVSLRDVVSISTTREWRSRRLTLFDWVAWLGLAVVVGLWRWLF
jgi:hypothetical protein